MQANVTSESTPDYIQAWQCIGCGRIEAPQTCIGVCRDRKIFVIGKLEHEEALAQIAALRAQLAEVRSQLLRFAHCTPAAGQHEQAFAALKDEVRRLIGQLPAPA